MELELTREDIEEIKKNMEFLTEFLINRFSSFNAAAFVLQSVLNATKEAETALAANEEI